jgi:hypothetical protein
MAKSVGSNQLSKLIYRVVSTYAALEYAAYTGDLNDRTLSLIADEPPRGIEHADVCGPMPHDAWCRLPSSQVLTQSRNLKGVFTMNNVMRSVQIPGPTFKENLWRHQ